MKKFRETLQVIAAVSREVCVFCDQRDGNLTVKIAVLNENEVD